MTKKMIKTIIVDDEPLARESLKNSLHDFEDIEILRECANGFEAVQAVQAQRPDVVFLDIQMPKLDGFDVVELLGNESPFIVFVTAYDAYAIKAFEAKALDYLLKPIQKERLTKTIERVKERISQEDFPPIDKLIETHRKNAAPLTRILVRDRSDVHIIPVEDVMYIEAQDDYIEIHTSKGSFLKNERISNLEEALDDHQFCRIHRSFIMNIEYLSKIEPHTKDSKLAILKNGRNLPISRSGYSKLTDLL
jgi:two-component system LytT family response regulator